MYAKNNIIIDDESESSDDESLDDIGDDSLDVDLELLLLPPPDEPSDILLIELAVDAVDDTLFALDVFLDLEGSE